MASDRAREAREFFRSIWWNDETGGIGGMLLFGVGLPAIVFLVAWMSSK